MKLNYRLFRLSSIFILITLGLSIMLTFFTIQNEITKFICNISLNIFAGAIILFATSLIEYFSYRRKDLESIMNFILKYQNCFSKIKYLKETKYLSYSEYKRNSKSKIIL